MLFIVALCICVGCYYYFYAAEEGILGGQSYEEAKEDFADLRPAETVWTPEEEEQK